MPEGISKKLQALRIMYALGRPCTPRDFAQAMWPDSPGWAKRTKRPRDGVTHGAVMITAGAAFLGRMVGSGLVERYGAWYRLSPGGMDYLLRQGQPPGPFPAAPMLAEAPWIVRDSAGQDTRLYFGPTGYMIWTGITFVPYYA